MPPSHSTPTVRDSAEGPSSDRSAVPGRARGDTVVDVADPPLDADDWTDEQWQAYLQATEADHVDGDPASPEAGATVFRRLKQSGAGAVIGAGMMGLEQALYGERPKEEIVAEAESDDPGRDRSVFDPEDPGSAVIALAVDPPPRAEDS